MAGTSTESPCEEPLDLETEWRALDALTVVDTIRTDVVKEKVGRRRQTDRVICTLWCGHTHPAGDLRQPSVKCNESTVPNMEHAVKALRLKIVD